MLYRLIRPYFCIYLKYYEIVLVLVAAVLLKKCEKRHLRQRCFGRIDTLWEMCMLWSVDQ